MPTEIWSSRTPKGAFNKNEMSVHKIMLLVRILIPSRNKYQLLKTLLENKKNK